MKIIKTENPRLKRYDEGINELDVLSFKIYHFDYNVISGF